MTDYSKRFKKIKLTKEPEIKPEVENKTETEQKVEKTKKEDGNIKGSEKIDVNDIKLESGETTTLNFMEEEGINDFFSKKTKQATGSGKSEETFGKGKTTEQLADDIKKQEDLKGNDWKPEDFYMVAEIIIQLLDTLAANAMRFWAKDTSDSAYSLNERKKSMLTRQLAMILIKYQAKFKIEFLFLLSIIMFYAPSFIKAKNRRKEIKEYELKESEKEIKKEPKVEIKSAVEIVEDEHGNYVEKEIKIEPEIVNGGKTEFKKFKRRPHRPAK